MSRTLRIGTRASRLARWQTDRVIDRLHQAGVATSIVEIRTTGDLVPDVPLPRIGDRALFTRQLDDALLGGRIDLAVHSLKDLATTLPEGMVIGAVGEREDPRDALVAGHGHSLATLPHGGIVATSSLRRRAQLLRLRPDLRVPDLRGNVDTRLRRLDERADWAGILLAVAGLVRLGLEHRIAERVSLDDMLPAPGQGALAVTVRAGDDETLIAVANALHDQDVARAVLAERTFLGCLEGGCHAPIAAYAEARGGEVALHGRVLSLDGSIMLEERAHADDAATLGMELASRLLSRGAADLLTAARADAGMAS